MDGQTPPAQWAPDPDKPGGLRYWDGTAWTEHRVGAAPPPTSAAAPTTASPNDWPPERIGALIAAGVVIAGSLGPWITVQTAFGSIAANGMDRDGQITVVAGIVIAVLVFVRKYIASMIVSAITVAIFLYDFVDAKSVLDDLGTEFAVGSVAWGLYAVGLGAALAFALSIALWRRNDRAKMQWAPTAPPL